MTAFFGATQSLAPWEPNRVAVDNVIPMDGSILGLLRQLNDKKRVVRCVDRVTESLSMPQCRLG